ncbi:virB8 family protein [Stenotrophomonas rhizophila]|uniref:virB8 family protein n=1 Tax=Stenotrophomonas rhizophila TaxID=216778 RepID=UPI0011A29792|nr:type IV secretion system protein [Stenotrophomonas rhizophila]
MFRKKDAGTSPKVDQAIAKAVSYELTVADLARRSERRAWWVAGSSLVMSLALAGGYYYMLPLKEKVPFLVMADAYTGTATVARLTGSFEGQAITASDAINRSNVAQYVMARESYDFAVMGLRDWQLVHVMSSRPVSDAIRARYANNNPQSPITLYGKDRAIRIKILSITPLEAQPNGGFRGASVRIQRSIYDKVKASTNYLDNQLVTLRFRYDNNLALNEQERILNPLGMEVFEYRVDNDYARGVPGPDDAALQQQAEQSQQAAWEASQAAAAAPAIDPVTGQPVAAPPGYPQAQPGQAPGYPGQAPAPAQAYPAQQAVPGPHPVQGQQMQGPPAPTPAQGISTGRADGASNR